MKTLIGSFLLLTSLSATPTLATFGDDPLTEDQVNTLIEKYIAQNPHKIYEALMKWQQEQELRPLEAAAEMYRPYLEGSESLVIGDVDGAVNLVEFMDYRCTFCRKHYQDMLVLLKEYPELKWLPKPVYQMDRNGESHLSELAARGAYAANLQGKFEQYHFALLSGASVPQSDEDIYQAARTAGVDLERFKADLNSEKVTEMLGNVRAIAEETGYWSAGTPAFLINGKAWIGASGIEDFRGFVDEAKKTAIMSR